MSARPPAIFPVAVRLRMSNASVQRGRERHWPNDKKLASRPPLQRFVRQPEWPVTSFISPAPSLTPQPRGLWPTAFAPPSGGCHFVSDHSRTANAACAAASHVSVCASDLPSLLCAYGCLTPAFSGAANGNKIPHENCASRPPLQRLVRRCYALKNSA